MRPSESESNDQDTRQQLERWLGFFRCALRFWRIPLGALLTGILACAIFLHVKKPSYRSETVVLYVEKGSAGDGAESAAARSVTIRLKELLLSRPTLERVVTEFDLYPDIRRTLGTVEAVEELKKHVEFRAPGGDTISIAFEGSTPVQAQGVTAELARLVIDGDAELRKNQAHIALEFLRGERNASEQQLHEAEQKLASFMAQHPRFALDATPLTSGAAIRASLTAAPSATGAWRAPPVSERAASPAASPAAPQAPKPEEALARAAVAAARQNLAEQLLHFTPAHPDVRAAQAELTRANERLATLQASGSTTDHVTTEPAPARPQAAPAPREPASHAPVTSAEQTKDLVALETQWLNLTRAVTEARQRQDQVEAQLFKADIQASSEGAGQSVQVDIIDPAFFPQRALPPGKTVIALIFLGVSLLLGGLGAVLFAAFDDRLFVARDIAGITAILVEVPKISNEWRYRAPS